jgi:hypothetical protein
MHHIESALDANDKFLREFEELSESYGGMKAFVTTIKNGF